MKTKRKDKFKNRNKPALKSWPYRIRQKAVYEDDGSFFGKFLGMRNVIEKRHIPIGTFCGRCGSLKPNGKCQNRYTRDGLPRFMSVYLKVVPRTYKSYFCIKGKEVFLNE